MRFCNRPAFSEAQLKSSGKLAHTSQVCGNSLHIVTNAESQCAMKVA